MILTVNIVNSALDPLSILANGITINDTSNATDSTFLSESIGEGECAKIRVEQNGYYSYSMTIDNVYKADKTIAVMLIPIQTDIEAPNYNRPYPYLFTLQDPCSFKVDYYNASSFPGDVSWYLNNNKFNQANLKGTFDLCTPGEYQLKMRGLGYTTTMAHCPSRQLAWDRQYATIFTGNSIISELDPIEDYLALDTITNITEVEYRPSFSLSASSPVDQIEQACCYTRDEEVTIKADVSITRPGSTVDDYNFEWSVIDPDGLEVFEDITPITLNEISFPLKKLGVYTVNVNLVDMGCDIVYPGSLIVETCNFITFDYNDCNSYTINNRSSAEDVLFSVESIEGESIVNNQTLVAGESGVITFGKPSLYFVEVTRIIDEVTVKETYVLNNYCVIEECFADYILDILCEDTRRCEACPDSVELNQLSLLFYSYFMELNKEYGLNNFYSGLEDSQLERLSNIAQVMDRILEFCMRRNCSKGSHASFGKDARPAGSETLDWAGKSNYSSIAKPGHCSTCNGK
jgi:hypothetical protein